MQYIIRTVQQVNQGKGVVIISDLNQMVDLNHYIFEETGIPCVSITPVSLNSVLHVVEIAEKKESSIDDFKDITTLFLHDSMNDSANLVGFSNYFLFEFSQKVLSQNLLFLDVNKASRALTSALANIYRELQMDYSDEITIRFLHHCSFMIERVVKNEALIFKSTKKIIESNKEIYQSIERNLTPVSQQFGITIPPNELAMVSIIFLDVQSYE
ncbi:PRD domain-containing protein [Alkalibaculum bacchi]|uniref:PRD domain-containing protein n=2 Tax=Alkalibaculum bacchi TaxID=645887 RepID=A0A366HWR9_9FIRM|nr:PRD domain-containing protein [Alkalibaculum bacchi]RBP57472.1 PRD domain-containing protein [Alkalibaculum bacchi]